MNRDENNHEEEEYEDTFKPMQCPYMKGCCPANPYMMNPGMTNPGMMDPGMCGCSPNMKEWGSPSMQYCGSPSMKHWGHGHGHGHGHGSRSIDSDFEDEDVLDFDPNDFRYPPRRPIVVPYMRPRPYYHHHRPYYVRPYFRPMWAEETFEDFYED